MQKMREFVHDHVFDTGERERDQSGVEGQNTPRGLTAAPARHHAPKANFGECKSKFRKEGIDILTKSGYGITAKLAEPSVDQPLLAGGIGRVLYRQRDCDAVKCYRVL